MANNNNQATYWIILIVTIFIVGILSQFVYDKYIDTVPETLKEIKPAHNYIDYSEYDTSIVVKDVQLIKGTGTSMFPTISTNNILIIQEYANTPLEEGQIVCYRNTDSSTCHRIIGSYWQPSGNGYIFVKGDALNKVDRVLTKDITYLVVGVLYN